MQSYLVLEVQPHLWHIQQEHRSEGLRDLDVIRSAQRFPAKVVKRELGNLARALRDHNRPTPRVQFSVCNRRIRRVGRGQRHKQLVHFPLVLIGQRVVVDM